MVFVFCVTGQIENEEIQHICSAASIILMEINNNYNDTDVIGQRHSKTAYSVTVPTIQIAEIPRLIYKLILTTKMYNETRQLFVSLAPTNPAEALMIPKFVQVSTMAMQAWHMTKELEKRAPIQQEIEPQDILDRIRQDTPFISGEFSTAQAEHTISSHCDPVMIEAFESAQERMAEFCCQFNLTDDNMKQGASICVPGKINYVFTVHCRVIIEEFSDFISDLVREFPIEYIGNIVSSIAFIGEQNDEVKLIFCTDTNDDDTFIDIMGVLAKYSKCDEDVIISHITSVDWERRDQQLKTTKDSVVFHNQNKEHRVE